jgi:hypothetical protein
MSSGPWGIVVVRVSWPGHPTYKKKKKKKKKGKNNDMTSTDGMLTYNKKKIIKFIRSMPILNAVAHHPQSLSCNLLHHRHRQNPDEQKRIKMFLLARTDIIN